MAQIWFEEGTRLIYIVPAQTVDTILPLKIDPAPEQTTRVFVGRIDLVSEATKRAVASAIAKSDWTAMEPYRRFLDPILTRMYPDANEGVQCRKRNAVPLNALRKRLRTDAESLCCQSCASADAREVPVPSWRSTP